MIQLGSQEQLKNVLGSITTNTPEVPKSKPQVIPGSTPELLVKLREVFHDRLPSPQEYAANPEGIIHFLYGQQSVIHWIASRLASQQTRESKETT